MERNRDSKLWFVVVTSSLGSLIEWYDLHLFGTLVTVFAFNFFPNLKDTYSFLSALITFGIAMAVRPISSLFLGWLGDSVGRKYTFLITLVLMGGSTSAIGLLPTYTQAEGFAVTLLFLLRIIQGVAFGGEYGASVLLIAEHAPLRHRGALTSIIHCMASVGLTFGMFTNMTLEFYLGREAFFSWGWRISFFISIVLVLISYLLRKNLNDPPAFHHLRITGQTSQSPIYESFHDKTNFRKILLVLLTPLAGQGVLWYTAYFYSFFYLHSVVGLGYRDSSTMVFTAILLAAPFNILFGHLSDKFGRMPIILTGLFASIIILFPTYFALSFLTENVRLSNAASDRNLYKNLIVATLFAQSFFVTMVYGPVAALLIDMFPMRIRFTSVSFPYHVANGIIGGSVPLIALSLNLTSQRKDALYLGLYYPFAVCVMSFTVGLLVFRSKIFKEQHV